MTRAQALADLSRRIGPTDKPYAVDTYELPQPKPRGPVMRVPRVRDLQQEVMP